MTFHRVGVEVDESRAVGVRTSRWRRLRPGDWVVRLGAIAVVLGVWELFGPTLNKLILRPPSDIFRAFFELIANGELQDAMGQSFRELFGGLAVALAVGLVLGVASGRWRFVYNAIDPLVSALYSVPSVALVPLIAVAFRSVGDAPRIATVALFAVFPILINTQQGVRNVDRQLLEVARSFNTSERRLWTDVILPSAMPYVLAGVRLAIGRGLIGMIVAEFFIGLVGLGYLIISYENVFRIDRMFVPVIVVATMGILMMGFVQWLEGRIAPWLKREQ
ncbi:MAG: ABC transporter permease [Chloroflexi bacterium]|nr:MAG: ABC transporter permease [Chloroflexota bacterium]TMF65371.1 MAG: ABC transporter permease [Chloroflexota bacterium]TMG63693.1 MAG: ABC transporter permease [Chloroflexota bacterium]